MDLHELALFRSNNGNKWPSMDLHELAMFRAVSGGGDDSPWSAVFKAEADGSYKTKYAIGDTIPLDLGAEGIVNMQIAAFDADELADGSGKAKITWISKELLNTEHRMNPRDASQYVDGTGAIGGWEKSEMRTYLKETIKPLIPEDVRNAIKEVTKYTRIYDTSGSAVNNVATTDDVWIPSNREVFANTSLETVGVIYEALFPNADSRIKSPVGSGSASTWWLRSASGTSNFRRVNVVGGKYDNGAYYSYGVALGFCT